jgi:hypothetical protein
MVFKTDHDRKRVLDKKETETKTDLSNRKTEVSQQDKAHTIPLRAKRR